MSYNTVLYSRSKGHTTVEVKRSYIRKSKRVSNMVVLKVIQPGRSKGYIKE